MGNLFLKDSLNQDLGLPLHTFKVLAIAKLTPNTLRTGVLEGKKFTAEEAFKGSLIDVVTTEAELRPKAIQWAKQIAPKGNNRTNFSTLKHDLYTTAYETLMKGEFLAPKF